MKANITDFPFLMVRRRSRTRQTRLSRRHGVRFGSFGQVSHEKKSGSVKQCPDFSAHECGTGLDSSGAASDSNRNTPVAPLPSLVHGLLSDVHQGRVSFLRRPKLGRRVPAPAGDYSLVGSNLASVPTRGGSSRTPRTPPLPHLGGRA